ncbi:MAG: nucleoside phosphorylase [Clostridia bacterium]|nr:nucleoside phosphorylase [Clostridia bacterium]
MMNIEKYPILEFDTSKEAVINPDKFKERNGILSSDKLIICFFKEAIKMLLDEGRIEPYKTITGENDKIIYRFVEDDILLVQGIVGCPATGGLLDELTGIGLSKVMFCGGAGVLDSSINAGELFVVSGAIRDEGFSYHYVKPSRIIYSQSDIVDLICSYLNGRGIHYTKGITWTTDAIFRETREKVALRKSEGARMVEMEQAGCIAVSQFRDLKYGAILYGGDDVSGDVWDERRWHDRRGVRYSMVEICRDVLKTM